MSSKKPVAEIELNLSRDESSRIVGFLGYGRLSAPVWFIGIEEGLGKANSEEAVSNLQARGRFERTMDLGEAHRLLHEKGKSIDIEHMETFVSEWLWMAKIMRACKGNKDWRELGPAKEYIRSQLGRRNGETFLAELSPIPSRNGKDKAWMKWFKEHVPDISGKIALRTKVLGQVLAENDPALVVCYGDGSTLPDKFAQLLKVEWMTVSERIRTSPDRRRLLLPFLGVGQFSHAIVQSCIDHKLLNCAPSAARSS
jgi:hypothetical protein